MPCLESHKWINHSTLSDAWEVLCSSEMRRERVFVDFLVSSWISDRLHTLRRCWQHIRSSGLQAPLFWHRLFVWYRSINHGWKPCCVYTAGVTHDDSDLCGTVHVQRAGKRENREKKSGWGRPKDLILQRPTAKQSPLPAASFCACLLFFRHRFDQILVSLLPVLACLMSSADVLFQRGWEGRCPLPTFFDMLLQRAERIKSLDKWATLG